MIRGGESKVIAGTNGMYEITPDGRVFSHYCNRFRKFGSLPTGYLFVPLTMDDGEAKNHYIHRLVAEYYIPNEFGKPTVNHKDGDKENNDVGNLEWATQKEQYAHAVETGLLKNSGEDASFSILTEVQVLSIRLRYLDDDSTTQTTLATEFGVTASLIHKIVAGKAWRGSWKPEYERAPNWKSTLSDSDIAQLVKEFEGGGITQKALGVKYGITQSGVSVILKRVGFKKPEKVDDGLTTVQRYYKKRYDNAKEISCACGCGGMLKEVSRTRCVKVTFINGHNGRKNSLQQ